MDAEPNPQDQTSTVEVLADWVLTVRPEEIPSAADTQAKLLLLDTIGCGLAGHDEHSAAAVLDTLIQMGGAPQCTVLGTASRLNVPNAVLANGTLIRVLDLNDYIIETDGSIGGHPSDNIPVALAAGEAFGRSGRDVLAAIVFGYELYGRCKRFMGHRSAWDGVSLSGFVAPAMAGWLMGLDRERLAHAIALSLARAATSGAVRSGHISSAKSLANALVAQNGVQAALLARSGLTGPLAVADHPRGVKEVFPKLDASTLASPLEADSYIMKANAKAYPCVATAQAAVDAALKLHKSVRPHLADVGRIRVVMADTPTIRRHQQDKERANPTSREAADHSFPFVVAASLLDGELGLGQFDGARWEDPDVVRLMSQIDMTVDPDLSGRAPGSYPCRIEVMSKDGRQLHQAEVLFPPGFSRGGLKEAAIVEKFHRVTSSHCPQPVREEIVGAALALDESPSLTRLTAALAKTAQR